MSESKCLFCQIAQGRIPADVIHAGDTLVAFRDIAPQAPVHFLVIPKDHVESLDEADPDGRDVLGDALLLARDLARSEGIADGGYRVVVNTGAHGGQTVHHLHVHVLGGRALGWPPG